MDGSLETLVIAGYVFACSLSIPRPGPAGKVTDQELIALAVAQAATGLVSDRQFLGTIGHLLPGFFPTCLSSRSTTGAYDALRRGSRLCSSPSLS